MAPSRRSRWRRPRRSTARTTASSEMRETYKRRRDVLVESFGRAGWQVPPPARLDVRLGADPGAVPARSAASSSPSSWSRRPRSRCRPGIGFGEHGEGFVRIALVENEQRIRQAARNIRRFLETGAGKAAQRRPSRHAALTPLFDRGRFMAAPLKVGLAGLGTVGASVVRLIDAAARRAARRRCGRPIEVVAVSAALARQGPRHRSEEAALGRRPGRACARSRHRRLRRADRRRRQSGASARSRPRSRPASRRHRQQGAAGASTASSSRRSPRSTSVALNFEAAVARRHPDREDAARGARRQCRRAHLRHPQRHLQLHPDAHGAGAAVVRRMPEGGAAARLRRGRSVVRHRGPRHRAEALDPGEPRLRHPASIRRAIYVEGISSITPADLEAADELGYRIKLLGVAVKTDKGIEQRVHPTMVRKDSAIAQVMGVTNAVTVDAEGIAADHAGRSRRRRHGDRLGGGRRHRRHRARRARRAVRPAVGASSRSARRRRCSATRAATTSACSRVDKPGTAATIAKRLAQQNISLESIVQRHRGPPGRRRRTSGNGPVPVILITYATTEDAVRKALAAVQARQGDLRAAASDPDRKELMMAPDCLEGRVQDGVDHRPVASGAGAHPVARDRARDRARGGVGGAAARPRQGEGVRPGGGRRHAARAQQAADRRHGGDRRGRAATRRRCCSSARRSATRAAPKVDIAVDPLEGTTLCAKNMPGAIATMAMAEAGTLLHAPDCLHGQDRDRAGLSEGHRRSRRAGRREHPQSRQGQGREAVRDHRDPARPAAPCRHDRGGAQDRRGGQPDHRRRRRRRDPLRRSRRPASTSISASAARRRACWRRRRCAASAARCNAGWSSTPRSCASAR